MIHLNLLPTRASLKIHFPSKNIMTAQIKTNEYRIEKTKLRSSLDQELSPSVMEAQVLRDHCPVSLVRADTCRIQQRYWDHL